MISDIQRLRQKHLFDNYDMSGMDAAYDDPPVGQMGDDSSTRLPTGRWDNYSDMPNAPEPSFPKGALRDIGDNYQEPQPVDPDEQSRRRLEEIFGQYKPDNTQSDRFNEMLNHYPQDKGPSLGRTLVASALAIGDKGSVEESQKFLHHPHDTDVEDWKNKIQPTYQSANLERQENINNRTLAYNTAQAENVRRRNEITDANNQEKADVARIRGNAYAWKQMHPDWDWDLSGPTIKIKEPGTNHVVDTGIETGKMPQEDLQILKNKGNVEAAEKRAESAYTNTVVRGQKTYQDSDNHQYSWSPDNPTVFSPIGDAPEYSGDKPLFEIKGPQKSTAKTDNYMKDRANTLQQYYDDPKYRPFIERPATANGTWQLKPPKSAFIGGIDPKQQAIYDELRQKVSGQPAPKEEPFEEGPKIPEGQTDINLPPDSKGASKVPRLKVVDPKTGRVGSIPNTQESINAAANSGLRIEVGR